MEKKIVQIPCNRCRVETNHSVISSKTKTDILDFEGEKHVLSSSTYQILSCNGCESYTFQTIEGYPNFFEKKENGKGYISRYKEIKYFYPERIVFLLEEKKYIGMPAELKLIYREVIDGFNQGQRILCAIGLRSLIEGTCRFLKVEGANLKQMIENLESSEHLSKTLVNSLESHRYLGNKAVHELQIPEKEELIHAIGLVEEMLNYTFNITDKHNRLIESLEKSKLKKSISGL